MAVVATDSWRSPAMSRVAGAGLASHLDPTLVAVVELKGDLGLTVEPRSTPAPPPAPPCRIKSIRPGSPASKAVPPIKVGDWIVSVQGQSVGSYFAAMNRINTAPRPLRLGLVRAAELQPEPEPRVPRLYEHECPDVRLSKAELEDVAELSAAEQLAMDPPPVQPGQREILQLEVEASVRANQRVSGGQYCVAAAQRVQLLTGDSISAPSPTGEYRVTVGPDELAAPGDMDLLEIAAKQFDGTHEIEGVGGVAAVSCRVSISCVGHAFRAGLRLQIPHCARSTAAVTALWGPSVRGPWQALPQGCSLSFSTALMEQVGEICLGVDPGPCWVVLVREQEYKTLEETASHNAATAYTSDGIVSDATTAIQQQATRSPRNKTTDAESAASGTGRHSRAEIEAEDIVYIVIRPVDRPAPLIDTDDLDGPEQELRAEQAELELRPDTAHGGSSARPPTAVEGSNGIRSALSSVFRCHNPSKLADIDRLLTEWSGNEMELLDQVRRTYDPASNRLRFPVDTDVDIAATMGPLLSELDTQSGLAVYGPFYVCRGVWYTLKLNLGPSGANRIASGPSSAAGIFLPVRQQTEPKRYLSARRTEFVLRVRSNASPAAAALSKQLAVCDDLRSQLVGLTPRNKDIPLPAEAVSIKLSIPGADKVASRIRQDREKTLATYSLPTDFLDGLILEACSANGEPRFYCAKCMRMFTPWPGRIKCDDCGQLATRKQVARIGIRLTRERFGVCNGLPEPEWAACFQATSSRINTDNAATATAVAGTSATEEVAYQRDLAEQARQAIEEDKRQRAAALAGKAPNIPATTAEDLQLQPSKACVLS